MAPETIDKKKASDKAAEEFLKKFQSSKTSAPPSDSSSRQPTPKQQQPQTQAPPPSLTWPDSLLRLRPNPLSSPIPSDHEGGAGTERWQKTPGISLQSVPLKSKPGSKTQAGIQQPKTGEEPPLQEPKKAKPAAPGRASVKKRKPLPYSQTIQSLAEPQKFEQLTLAVKGQKYVQDQNSSLPSIVSANTILVGVEGFVPATGGIMPYSINLSEQAFAFASSQLDGANPLLMGRPIQTSSNMEKNAGLISTYSFPNLAARASENFFSSTAGVVKDPVLLNQINLDFYNYLKTCGLAIDQIFSKSSEQAKKTLKSHGVPDASIDKIIERYDNRNRANVAVGSAEYTAVPGASASKLNEQIAKANAKTAGNSWNTQYDWMVFDPYKLSPKILYGWLALWSSQAGVLANSATLQDEVNSILHGRKALGDWSGASALLLPHVNAVQNALDALASEVQSAIQSGDADALSAARKHVADYFEKIRDNRQKPDAASEESAQLMLSDVALGSVSRLNFLGSSLPVLLNVSYSIDSSPSGGFVRVISDSGQAWIGKTLQIQGGPDPSNETERRIFASWLNEWLRAAHDPSIEISSLVYNQNSKTYEAKFSKVVDARSLTPTSPSPFEVFVPSSIYDADGTGGKVCIYRVLPDALWKPFKQDLHTTSTYDSGIRLTVPKTEEKSLFDLSVGGLGAYVPKTTTGSLGSPFGSPSSSNSFFGPGNKPLNSSALKDLGGVLGDQDMGLRSSLYATLFKGIVSPNSFSDYLKTLPKSSISDSQSFISSLWTNYYGPKGRSQFSDLASPGMANAVEDYWKIGIYDFTKNQHKQADAIWRLGTALANKYFPDRQAFILADRTLGFMDSLFDSNRANGLGVSKTFSGDIHSANLSMTLGYPANRYLPLRAKLPGTEMSADFYNALVPSLEFLNTWRILHTPTASLSGSIDFGAGYIMGMDGGARMGIGTYVQGSNLFSTSDTKLPNIPFYKLNGHVDLKTAPFEGGELNIYNTFRMPMATMLWLADRLGADTSYIRKYSPQFTSKEIIANTALELSKSFALGNFANLKLLGRTSIQLNSLTLNNLEFSLGFIPENPIIPSVTLTSGIAKPLGQGVVRNFGAELSSNLAPLADSWLKNLQYFIQAGMSGFERNAGGSIQGGLKLNLNFTSKETTYTTYDYPSTTTAEMTYRQAAPPGKRFSRTTTQSFGTPSSYTSGENPWEFVGAPSETEKPKTLQKSGELPPPRPARAQPENEETAEIPSSGASTPAPPVPAPAEKQAAPEPETKAAQGAPKAESQPVQANPAPIPTTTVTRRKRSSTAIEDGQPQGPQDKDDSTAGPQQSQTNPELPILNPNTSKFEEEFESKFLPLAQTSTFVSPDDLAMLKDAILNNPSARSAEKSFPLNEEKDAQGKTSIEHYFEEVLDPLFVMLRQYGVEANPITQTSEDQSHLVAYLELTQSREEILKLLDNNAKKKKKKSKLK